jgi:hypothetical protein
MAAHYGEHLVFTSEYMPGDDPGALSTENAADAVINSID